MYARQDFSPSQPGEREPYSFDFMRPQPQLADGETITAVTFSCEAYQGTDDAASACIDGAAAIDATGKIVSQWIMGLKAGVTYRLTAVATTSLGATRKLYSHVACQTPA